MHFFLSVRWKNISQKIVQKHCIPVNLLISVVKKRFVRLNNPITNLSNLKTFQFLIVRFKMTMIMMKHFVYI